MKLQDAVRVAPRYTRSIQLERDAGIPGAIDGYVVTSTAHRVLQRLVETLKEPAGHRAWTLTGPYGSGKSAFALYLANLFRPPVDDGGRLARRILETQHPELYLDSFGHSEESRLERRGFVPILISGSPEPFLKALLRACLRDFRNVYNRGRPPGALKELEALDTQLRAGNPISSTSTVDAITRLCSHLQSSGKARGVLLVVDELGKFLEFAARDPRQGDIYILQQLAEATAQGNPPALLVVTILHQAFERYAADLTSTFRAEWAKVQGRFEDIAFQEPPEQLLGLVAAAIEHPRSALATRIQKQARGYAKSVIRLDLMPRGLAEVDFVRLVERCAPLHPLALLSLVRLCRKFGQNQRSLFSFLVSAEPHGFASFLQQEVDEHAIPFYGLAELYDYVAEALGSGLNVGEAASRWAQVQVALDRAKDATAEEIRLIKIVGLLNAIGISGSFKPTPDLACLALGTVRAFRKAHDALSERSILVERKHTASLALWEGSDLDLDEQLREAEHHVPNTTSLASKVAALWDVRPLVAKRHSFRTGTLRYLAVRFADGTNFTEKLQADPDADGIVLYCVPNSPDEFEQLREWARTVPAEPDTAQKEAPHG